VFHIVPQHFTYFLHICDSISNKLCYLFYKNGVDSLTITRYFPYNMISMSIQSRKRNVAVLFAFDFTSSYPTSKFLQYILFFVSQLPRIHCGSTSVTQLIFLVHCVISQFNISTTSLFRELCKHNCLFFFFFSFQYCGPY